MSDLFFTSLLPLPPRHKTQIERIQDVQKTPWMFFERLIHVQFAFCVQGVTRFRGVFRTLSNICVEAFLRKWLKSVLAANYFRKITPRDF